MNCGIRWRVASGLGDPAHDEGDAGSNEGQDAVGQISGESDLAGKLGTPGAQRSVTGFH